MTITQTVDIPASHRLTIDVPREIPAGKARVEMKVIPFAGKKEKSLSEGTESATPIADSLVGILSGMGDIDFDAIRMERLAKHL